MAPKLRRAQTTPKHVAFMNDLKAAMSKHPHLSGMEMLALTSQLVGNLAALQDQTQYTSEQVLAIIGSNIEIGNQTAIEGLFNHEGGKQ